MKVPMLNQDTSMSPQPLPHQKNYHLAFSESKLITVKLTIWEKKRVKKEQLVSHIIKKST